MFKYLSATTLTPRLYAGAFGIFFLFSLAFLFPNNQLKAQSVMTPDEMEARILQLIQIINQLQAQLALQEKSPEIVIGSRVQTTDDLSVRSTPGGTLLSVAPSNMSGAVIEGPGNSGSYTWWKIKYDNGVSGWSAFDWLRVLPTESPTASSSVEKDDQPSTSVTPPAKVELETEAIEDQVSVPTKKTTEIFDLVDELKPESKEKELLVVADINDLGCKLKYDNKNSNLTGVPASQLRSTFFQSEWILAEWYKLQNLCQHGEVRNAKDNLQFFVEDPEKSSNNLKEVDFLPGLVRMNLKSVDIYRVLYGSDYYSAKNPEGHALMPTWPHLLLQKQFPFTKLSDYESLDLSVKTTLRYAGVKTDKINKAGLANTVTEYDPTIHSTHFRFVFPIQWRDPSCKRLDVNDPVCKHFGKYVHVTFLLFDERYEFKESGISTFDPPSGQWIYAIDLRDVLEGGESLTKNPFKELNQSAEMNTDLKQLFSEIIFELEDKALGQKLPGRFLPPRLVIDGVEETDEEYLAHFGFAGFNIGYEANGLSHMVYEIEDFSLTGVK